MISIQVRIAVFKAAGVAWGRPWRPEGMAAKRKSTGKTETALGHRGILARVNRDGWRALSLLAIERDTSLQALAVEAFNDLLVKCGKRPIVSGPVREEED
jgi:hypothetical protein